MLRGHTSFLKAHIYKLGLCYFEGIYRLMLLFMGMGEFIKITYKMSIKCFLMEET